MNEDLPDAVNRDGGESDVVAERSGADTPKARRPIPADWPDTETNPAIPVPDITAPEPEAEATADVERRAETDGEAGEEVDDGAEKEVRPEAGPTG
ncbi:hypothetical protein [Nonomuraea guangzhouensis]|uniref:Uncharacterized protein n=1 Tax=Nonomuraea guangzhouensis TaxID=1291555 RepID=A0ABW4GL40_9ACTN|nr:hypothetical protein [Nonomuraea guangzhouensis]